MGMCFSCIENGSVGLVTQCGAFKRIATPGFNCICCCTGEMVQDVLNLRQQQLNVELETKTKDDVSVKVVVSVQYLISNDKDYSHEGSYYKAYYKVRPLFPFTPPPFPPTPLPSAVAKPPKPRNPA